MLPPPKRLAKNKNERGNLLSGELAVNEAEHVVVDVVSLRAGTYELEHLEVVERIAVVNLTTEAPSVGQPRKGTTRRFGEQEVGAGGEENKPQVREEKAST